MNSTARALYFHGVPYHLPKPEPDAPFRAASTDETWQRLRPLLHRAGITRVADITGMDRIGLPVWIAVRPASWSLSVSQGKGVSAAAARCGAVGESLETYVAERAVLATRRATYRELSDAREECVDPLRCVLMSNSLYHSDRVIEWAAARDLASDEVCWIPRQLVDMDFRLPETEPNMFLRSSNGLASGTHVLEALYHALCEAIERDAVTLTLEATPFEAWLRRLVRLDTIEHGPCRVLLDHLERAGLMAFIVDATSDIGLPTMFCWIADRARNDPLRFDGFFFGAGAHHNPYHAMVRAVSEAVQSRGALISGGRDDLVRRKFDIACSDFFGDYLRPLYEERAGVIDARQLAHCGQDSVEDDIRYALDRLAAVGLERVVAIRLTDPALPLEVVRVVVPGLEPPIYFSAARRGERWQRVARQYAGHSSPVREANVP